MDEFEEETAIVPRPAAAVAVGVGVDLAPPDPLAVYLDTLPSANSRRTMRQRLDRAAGILAPGSTAATFPWAGLDYAAVTRVVGALAAENAPPSTINLTRSALRGLARTLFALRMLDGEELARIEHLKAARGSRLPRGRDLTPRELRKLFKICANDPTAAGRRDAALLAVLYGGGLRREEASGLDLTDVRGDGLRVQGKGNRERVQPVGPDTMCAVQAWVATRREWAGPLFVTVNKGGKVSRRRLTGDAIHALLQRLVRRAAIDPASPHDLRRTFVGALLSAGEDLSTASKAAGHASINTTARYDRRDGARVAAAIAKVPVPFGG